MIAEFTMPIQENNKVEWDFWLTSSSDRALDFLENFSPMQKMFGDSVSFNPHYVFWECPKCNLDLKIKDCYSDGAYCAIDTSNGNLLGREIIQEDLRQMCLWNRVTL